MTLRFGTDGVRGVANTELTVELTTRVGRAAARVMGGDQWLIARDTRWSGPVLTSALAAGLASHGVTAVDLGVLPTPGLAHLANVHGLPAVMISASHNPYADNGLKLFAAGGHKLSDEVEDAIEAELEALAADEGHGPARPSGNGLGILGQDPSAAEAYARHLVGRLGGRKLSGLRVVVDCAHGAAAAVGPQVLTELGADVVVLNAEPDGTNINHRCGSSHPEALADQVVRRRASVGLALDGDADRLIAVDENGAVIDGDQIVALCAKDLADAGRLAGNAVAVTVMTNLGFRLAMVAAGIGVVETPVGDRNVLAAITEHGLSLGGEQSGHVIFSEQATTGDGLLTALTVLDVMKRTGKPLSALAGVMTRLPQVLRNVEMAERDPAIADKLASELEAAQAELGEGGRVLLRPSGTEALVRVMVEAPTETRATELADRLAEAVAATVGA